MSQDLINRAKIIRYEDGDEENTAERVGSWMEDAAIELTQKADAQQLQALDNKVDNLESHKKGYFSTLQYLISRYPNPVPGDYAYVGETGTIFEYANGAWANTQKPIPEDVMQLDEFAKTKNEEGIVVRTEDGKINIPDNVVTYRASMGSEIKLNNYLKTGYFVSNSGNGQLGQSNKDSDIAVDKLPLAVGKYIIIITESVPADVKIHFYNNATDINSYKTSQLTNNLTLDIDEDCYISFNIANATGRYNLVNSLHISTLNTSMEDGTFLIIGEKTLGVDEVVTFKEETDEESSLDVDITSYVKKGYFVSNSQNGAELTGSGSDTMISKLPLKGGVSYNLKWDRIDGEYFPTVHFYSNKNAVNSDYSVETSATGTTIKPDSDVYISLNLYSQSATAGFDITDSVEIKEGVALFLNLGGRSVNISSLGGGDISLRDGFNDKIQIELTEIENKWISLDGKVQDGKGIVATSPLLDTDSYYLVELKKKLDGRYIASLGGNPLAFSGRETFWFKTDDKKMSFSMMVLQGDNLDVRGKYKMYKINRSLSFAKGDRVFPFGRIAADYSDFPSLEIEEPKWCKWNINGNYQELTATKDYSKDRVLVEYLDSNGIYFQKYATIGGQGYGSMIRYEMHNAKMKLQNKDGSKFYLKLVDMLPRSTYHIKVNYTDFSQLKNLGVANFITDWYRSNEKTHKTYAWEVPFDVNSISMTDVYDNRARGITGGVPCSICTYWNHWSSGNFILNVFTENFRVDEDNPLHKIYKGSGYEREQWEELVSDTEGAEMPEDVWLEIEALFNWYESHRKAEKMQYFITASGVKYHKEDMIDFWLTMEFFYLWDSGGANMVWRTTDGVMYRPHWHDMDCGFGSNYDGVTQFNPNQEFIPNGGVDRGMKYWEALLRAYPNDIKQRYHDLRDSGRFSLNKIREIFGGLADRFPYEWHEMDYHQWKINRSSITAGNLSSLKRILWFIDERIKYLDNKYDYTI